MFQTSLLLLLLLFASEIASSHQHQQYECSDGESRIADDGCNTCACFGGVWGCTLMACPQKMPECSDGESRIADDGCNTCACFGGVCGCTLMACSQKMPECSDGESKIVDDGCNTCACFGGVWGCTKMACPQKIQVPCNNGRGLIQQQSSCPWWTQDPSQCTKYDACVCRDGFIGGNCEHDCARKACPKHYAPVYAGNIDGGDDITYDNTCLFYNAECNNNDKQRLYFLYDGACQDATVCGPISCPMDVSVAYYDDPNRPGCKLCRPDPNA